MSLALILLSFLVTSVSAELSGPVGPLVDAATKGAHKTCNILDYGAEDGSDEDVGPAITQAWADCAQGGLVYIPPGTYQLASSIGLEHGNSSAIQWDGLIERSGEDFTGHMIYFDQNVDFEVFSGNSQGAMQGYGYEYLQDGTYGVRFLRFIECVDWSFHGIALIDSPSYYVVIEECSNGEVYNLILRGVTDLGMSDGIDISGDNNWVHDVEVSNGDECVTIKSPATNFRIESIYCNYSGGTAIGSLGLDTKIANITYKRLYMNQADACYLKTNNGNGTVSDISWDEVYIHGGAYVLAVNAAWGDDYGEPGVEISGLTFKNWYGFNSENFRPTIRLDCDEDQPCRDIHFDNVNLWTSDGDTVYWSCQNAFGTGACLKPADQRAASPTYTKLATITSTPTYHFQTMAADFTEPPPSTQSFTIPPIPTSFFPGQAPSSSLLDLKGAAGSSANLTTSTSSNTTGLPTSSKSSTSRSFSTTSGTYSSAIVTSKSIGSSPSSSSSCSPGPTGGSMHGGQFHQHHKHRPIFREH